MTTLEEQINSIWPKYQTYQKSTEEFKQAKKIVKIVLNSLDNGSLRAANKNSQNEWIVNEWVKKAILMSFKLYSNEIISNTGNNWFDKIPLKFDTNWEEEQFLSAKIRAVPGSYVRKGAYIGENSVLMPCFVNIGAYIGANTMIDTWATIGSCAQIGENCHISGGTGIGGVLEPLQANPVIIEDNCFIGARSEIVEGVKVCEGSVIGMGVYLGATTKIFDKQTGEVHYGSIPPFSVVVPGSYNVGSHGLSQYCAIIIKQVDQKTRSKTSINDLLREI